MIEFRQKEFTEYDAMRSLYLDFLKYGDKNKYKVIDQSALLPILKGNNVVIERFVITTKPFTRKQKFRTYIRVGARAKLPDDVRLPNSVYDQKLLDAQINFYGGVQNKENDGKYFSDTEKNFSNAVPDKLSANVRPFINITYEVEKEKAHTVKYSKKERLLVLEHDSIQDAMHSINILPFGINYNICLLEP